MQRLTPRRLIMAVAATCCLAASQPALASTILYDNQHAGDPNSYFGQNNSWTINFGYVVSDSFPVGAGGETIDEVQFWAWEFPGDTLSTVDWGIGTSPGDTTLSTGTASVTDTFLFVNQYGYNIDAITFPIAPPLALGPGTYWLSLFNASVASGDPVYWDENDGPSAAWESAIGSLANCEGSRPPGTCSHSFQILGPSGEVSPVPEPASLTLLGLGLAGMGARRWRQRKKGA